MDFQQLCTFDFFTQVSDQYGYGGDFQEVVEKEFKRSKGITYLDHAGTTLYPESAVQSFCQDISTSLYGNPHSHSPSSRLTHDTVERVRYRILQHFNADPEEYSVIFTSGSTAALRLAAESFPWSPGSIFSYLTDNHTSVVGMRGLTSDLGVTTLPVRPEALENTAKNTAREGDISRQTPHLFCFPAQSNFSGKKYALSYVRGIQARRLYPASGYDGKWFVLLDAASYVSSSPLNLKQYKADLIPVSFYKLLGFPSGLGALLVHRDAAAVLRKRYFGGGTAMAYLSGEDYYVPAKSPSDRNMTRAPPLCAQVDRMASLYNIHVRTGCFCNTGACQDFLGISDEQMKRNLEAGHVCGDNVDLVSGRPTGSVRVSFGYMSTFPDCQNFLRFVAECFVEGPATVDRERVERLANATSPRDPGRRSIARPNGEIREEEEGKREEERGFGKTERNGQREEGCTLTNIYIYPVKSCGAFEVQQWPLGDRGLLFDRGWMVVNVNGVCLSQKREPRLCLIKPEIQLSRNQLQLNATGMESISVPLETEVQSEVCQSKVCGDRVETLDCGEAVAQWLSDFLQQKCRLIRLSPDFTRDAKRKKQQEPGQGEVYIQVRSIVRNVKGDRCVCGRRKQLLHVNSVSVSRGAAFVFSRIIVIT
ncbi:molybdenum cofactor sulfurase [Boleophthalmus pectinirostris]|uniref:molybdenum cofactor sulfurase n=1 Tax=Boleophthalmus pectinirostris TaxID=150288 RepID=UPI00242A4E6F|nr:molybdenum cofactor sulfurase [Boleophthalmus pectinirostris]